MKEVRSLTTTQDRIPSRAHSLDNLVNFTNTYPLDSDLSLFWSTSVLPFLINWVLFWFGKKTEHFKALAKSDNTSAIADHVKTTGHNIKWDQFDILAKGKTDYHCKIKETLYIQELEPAFNVNVGSEKLMLY